MIFFSPIQQKIYKDNNKHRYHRPSNIKLDFYGNREKNVNSYANMLGMKKSILSFIFLVECIFSNDRKFKKTYL